MKNNLQSSHSMKRIVFGVILATSIVVPLGAKAQELVKASQTDN